MNITELRYLVAIMKWGSVSAAAKQVAYNTAVAYPIGIVFAIAMLAIFIYATKKHTASQKA